MSPEVSCFRFDMRVWWKASVGCAYWWFQPFFGIFWFSGLISSFPDLDCSCGLATTLFGSTRCTRALLATFSVLSRDGVMEVTVPPRFPCWCSYSRFSTKHCDATFTKCPPRRFGLGNRYLTRYTKQFHACVASSCFCVDSTWILDEYTTPSGRVFPKYTIPSGFI